MIVSENNKPKLSEFKELMNNTNNILNSIARESQSELSTCAGTKLEPYVERIMNEAAIGTPFEGTIKRWGNKKFPDIVANKYYGVEVKSTTGNHWSSIGNSILESTRVEDVEHIFILFGKLAAPVEFKTRLYQECLSDIVVTHYPRYFLNMNLPEGESIFDKMGISYDDLRMLDQPTIPVANYYRKQLKEGQSLWWLGDTTEDIEAPSPIAVRIWNTLDEDEKEFLIVRGMVLFPECLATNNNPKKYNRLSLWLTTNKGVVVPNIRDIFSAGGRSDLTTRTMTYYRLPKVFSRINRYKDQIFSQIYQLDIRDMERFWNRYEVNNPVDRIRTWIDLVVRNARHKERSKEILLNIFDISIDFD